MTAHLHQSSEKPTKPIGRFAMVVVPPDPGRKSSHLVLVTHDGGGWYSATCMGQAKRCRSGECAHARGLRWADSRRPIRQAAKGGRGGPDA